MLCKPYDNGIAYIRQCAFLGFPFLDKEYIFLLYLYLFSFTLSLKQGSLYFLIKARIPRKLICQAPVCLLTKGTAQQKIGTFYEAFIE
uniref:Uncharacterized protein n=1 Tax=uncultured Desulfobacterium sp. TaxID=201089 RepID=E1Y928_9BACT|nr:unknown protein [uncultured Desulfobacterium sp.]